MKVQNLKVQEIISLLNKGELFEANTSDAGFIIKVSKYVPYVCTAIHD